MYFSDLPPSGGPLRTFWDFIVGSILQVFDYVDHAKHLYNNNLKPKL